MMPEKIRLLIALFLLWIISCNQNPSTPESNYQPELNVFAVLDPQKEVQEFIINYSFQITEPIPQNLHSVPGINVVVKGGGQEVTFQLDSLGFYSDRNTRLNVQPRETYTLMAWDSQNRRAEGTTRVPGEFHIIDSTEVINLSLYQWTEVFWSTSPGAYRYLVFTYRADSSLYEGLWPLYDITADTSVKLFPYEPGDYTLKILACDENYYDYYRVGNRGSDSEYTNHLLHGIGVFGSVVAQEVRVSVE